MTNQEISNIEFKLEIVNDEEIHGIIFNNSAFIKIYIDYEDILAKENFSSSVLVFDELNKSKISNGQYLIFTCTCGVADDAGWDLINVEKLNDVIIWKFERDNENIIYIFSYSEYCDKINLIMENIKKLGNSIILEPNIVVFPE